MNLVLIKEEEISKTGVIDLQPTDERAKHILHHLKKATGDEVSIGCIQESQNGYKCKAEVKIQEHNGVQLIPKPNTIIQSPIVPEITLILAVPFPARLKYLWPVIASFIGVSRVVIIKSALSNPEFELSKALQNCTYEPLLEKGMSQGSRTRPVKVDICLDENESISDTLKRLGLIFSNKNNSDGVARVLLDCGDENVTPPPVRDIIMKHCGSNIQNGSVVLAIGPERGWSEQEARKFVECGFEAATLGNSILRVDTAVISGLAICSATLDECHKQHNSGDRDVKRKRQDDTISTITNC